MIYHGLKVDFIPFKFGLGMESVTVEGKLDLHLSAIPGICDIPAVFIGVSLRGDGIVKV